MWDTCPCLLRVFAVSSIILLVALISVLNCASFSDVRTEIPCSNIRRYCVLIQHRSGRGRWSSRRDLKSIVFQSSHNIRVIVWVDEISLVYIIRFILYASLLFCSHDRLVLLSMAPFSSPDRVEVSGKRLNGVFFANSRLFCIFCDISRVQITVFSLSINIPSNEHFTTSCASWKVRQLQCSLLELCSPYREVWYHTLDGFFVI